MSAVWICEECGEASTRTICRNCGRHRPIKAPLRPVLPHKATPWTESSPFAFSWIGYTVFFSSISAAWILREPLILLPAAAIGLYKLWPVILRLTGFVLAMTRQRK